jgi:hypothetical protein
VSRLDDMTRLRDQVQAGRRERKSLVANLALGCIARRVAVGGVREANMAANDERSRSLMASLSAFMANLAMHEKGRRQVAGRSRKARVSFIRKVGRDVAALARDVASTRHANRTENAASRTAWRGVTVAAHGKRGAKSTSPSA